MNTYVLTFNTLRLLVKPNLEGHQELCTKVLSQGLARKSVEFDYFQKHTFWKFRYLKTNEYSPLHN